MVCDRSSLAARGGGADNGSTRPFEPAHQFPKKLTHNGKQVHLQFTYQQNLRAAMTHLATGEPWEPVDIDDGTEMVVDYKTVQAGQVLIDLIKSNEKYRMYTPYDSSVATVKESSSLAVACVDWERGLWLDDTVVELRNRYSSTKADRKWVLPRDSDTLIRNPTVYTESDCLNVLVIGMIQSVYDELYSAYEGVHIRLGPAERATLCRTLDVLTNVVPSDERRDRLLSVHARIEKGGCATRYGTHLRVTLDGSSAYGEALYFVSHEILGWTHHFVVLALMHRVEEPDWKRRLYKYTTSSRK
eukprot:55111-Eustigmatos_ZCMA.PRE.1